MSGCTSSSPAHLRFIVALFSVVCGCHGRGIKVPVKACAADQAICMGPTGQEICTSLQTNAAHCGRCGVTCAPGQSCIAGTCQLRCPTPLAPCPTARGNTMCTDLHGDVDNCGGCGVVCPGGQVCAQGRCSWACPPPQILCPSAASASGAFCANLQNDNLHCGDCEHACLGDLACVNGVCSPCQRSSILGAVRLLDLGLRPQALALPDLDKDGKLDIVALNPKENTVSVRMGDADGEFSDRVAYTTGTGPTAMAIADFNGDSYPDLAVANASGQDVALLLWSPGTHVWREGSRLPLPSLPLAITAGDVNADDRPDLVLALQGSSGGDLLIRLGNQDGTFAAAFSLELQGTPTALVLSDLNADGRQDFALSLLEGSVAVALAGADGKPGSFRRFAAEPGCAAIMAADLDDDNRLDLVTASPGDDGVSVLLGQGNGTFGSARHYPTGAAPAGLFAADLNRDGKLDVLVGTPTDHSVRVLPGLGNGTLGAATTIPGGPAPSEVRAADLNGDGALDLVLTNVGDENRALSVILARAPGEYRPRAQRVADPPNDMRLADVDGDGRTDSVLLGKQLTIMSGLGDGAFAMTTSYELGDVSPVAMETADLNQDGALDVAVATSQGLSLLLGDRSGRLAPAQTAAAGVSVAAFAMGDINHDGRLDLAVTGPYGINLLVAQGNGDYQNTSLTYSSCACEGQDSLRLVDLNLDGWLDLVAITGRTGHVQIWMATGDGGFAKLSESMRAVGEEIRLLGITYPRGQGWPGLALVDRGGNTSSGVVTGGLASYAGRGDGRFTTGTSRALGALVGNGALVDLDDDLLLDAVLPLTTPLGHVRFDARERVMPESLSATTNSVVLAQGQAGGSFGEVREYWLESPASAADAADLDGDGDLDLVMAHDAVPGLTVFLRQVSSCK